MSKTTVKGELVLGPLGFEKIKIEGLGEIQDQISEMQLNSAPGQPTTLFLRQNPGEATIEFEGVIYVEQDHVDILKLLERTDPKELEGACLQQQTWGDNRNIVEIVLDELKERITSAQVDSDAKVHREGNGR